MVFPRQIINEFKWRCDRDLKKLRIFYVHRGAPGDTGVISGEDIVDIGRSFLNTGNSMIPYHRIRIIEYLDEAGNVVERWEF